MYQLIQFKPQIRKSRAAQQQRLADLMALWHNANDQDLTLPANLQTELDNLAAAELKAATARSAAMLTQISREP